MAAKRKFRVEAIVLSLLVVGFGAWGLWSWLSRLGCGDVDDAFARIAADFADRPDWRQLVDGVKLDRGSVPCLLDKLTDVGEVAEIQHPGGHDKTGMPVVGHAEVVRVRDLAKRVLKVAGSRGPEGFSQDIEDAVRALLLSATSPVRMRYQFLKSEMLHSDYAPIPVFLLQAMGEIGLAEARGPLVEVLDRFMLEDSDWKWSVGRMVIGATLTSLAAVGDAATVEHLVRHLLHPGCDFLGHDIGKTLGAIGHLNIGAVLRGLEEALRLKDAKDRMLATEAMIEVLGSVQSKESVDALLAWLDGEHKEPEIEWLRSQVIMSLGRLRDRRSAGRLALEFLTGGGDARTSAEYALREIFQGARAEEFAPRVREGGDDGEQLAAVFALGLVGGAEELALLKGIQGPERLQQMVKWAVPVIETRLAVQEKEARERALSDAWGAVSSGRIAPEQAVPLLVELLRCGRFEGYECQIMDFLGAAAEKRRLPPEAVALLRSAVAGEERWTALCAARALGRAGDKTGLALTRKIMAGEDEMVKALKPTAALAYLEITGQVHPKLERGLRLEEEPYVNAVLTAAGTSPSRRLRGLLERLSKTARNEQIAVRALDILKRLK